jgi:hypothetical protein
MRCQRCQFENIPGESRCFKCGSILGDHNVPVDVCPPRMSKWQGPFRSLVRQLRFWSALPEESFYGWVPDWMKIMSGNAFLSLFLSIVPGLAHFTQRRFRQVRWYLVAWFVFLLTGMFLYGGFLGFLLIGLAVAMHVWVAFHAALLVEHQEMGYRVFDVAFLLFLYMFFYWGIRILVFRDFVFANTAVSIPHQNVKPGDCLLARHSLSQPGPFSRGSLVVIHPVSVMAGYHNRRMVSGQLMTVQIVGLPGEEVQIKDNAFVVNGRILDTNEYFVPNWMMRRKLRAIHIGDSSYFVNNVYNITGHGDINVNEAMLESVCVVSALDIDAKVIMRWLPLIRRGFLRSDE